MLEPHPNYLAYGKGCWAFDVDGNGRIDFTNNFGALIHGYSHPEIVKAITEQAGRAVCSTMPTSLETELAALICERLPTGDKIRFTNSGTEAVMLALKMARSIAGKPKIAKIEGGYHGQYEYIDSSSTPSPSQWGDPTEPPTIARNSGTPGYMLPQLVVLPCNDIESSRKILAKHKEALAAVIVDPMQLQVGYGRPEVEYLKALRDEATRLGILLIFDEVVAFRNGLNGTQGRVGVTPDITVLGKFIGGGLPVGAVCGSDEVMSVFKISREGPRVLHSGTFSANPLTMAAGAATMRLLTSEVFDRFQSLQDRLSDGMDSVLQTYGVDARLEQYCIGSTKLVFGSAQIRNWRDLYQYYQNHQLSKVAPLQEALLKRKVLVSRLSFLISSPMTEADIEVVLEAFDDAVKELAPQLRGECADLNGSVNQQATNSLT
ncbi:hypothetical protein X734_33085 [Mesorhizobium sp. L2C084A000]|nr:hypothetical protein X734_33085 [Mesorhizobium sp. L2C084A000]